MSHERESASTLSPPSTAPMRRVCYQEKEQDRCIEQFYLTVQLAAAWSELLTTSEGDKPGENASSCHPDKESTKRQGNAVIGDHSLIRYDQSMARVQIRLARSSDCRGLAEMRYRFRTE